jgi:hypothetical protein
MKFSLHPLSQSGSLIILALCCRDYRPIPELDRYRQEELDDDGDFSDLSMSERLAAEREMRKRDHDEAMATGRMRPGILYGESVEGAGLILNQYFMVTGRTTIFEKHGCPAQNIVVILIKNYDKCKYQVV